MSEKKPINDVATRLCEDMIGAPNLFSEVIRALIVDYGKGNFKYSSGSKFLTLRLIKAPSVQCPLYFATLTFMKEQFDGVDSLQPEELIQLYKPLEMAVLLTNLYLFKKAHQVTPPDEWSFIKDAYFEQMEIGGHFGYAIPDIGPAHGLLVGGLRPLSLAVFAQHFEKEFKNYRRALKGKPNLYDIKQEVALFGCSHVDVVRTLMQSLGFGAGMARGIFDALSDAPISEDDITGDFARFSASGTWIESLSVTSDIPHSEEEDDDHDEKAINKLITVVKSYKEKGSEYFWPSKKPEEYPRQDLLFKIAEKKAKVKRTKIIEAPESLSPAPRSQEVQQKTAPKLSDTPSQSEIDDIFNQGSAIEASPTPTPTKTSTEAASTIITDDEIESLFSSPQTLPAEVNKPENTSPEPIIEKAPLEVAKATPKIETVQKVQAPVVASTQSEDEEEIPEEILREFGLLK